jgi:hypothetical protein
LVLLTGLLLAGSVAQPAERQTGMGYAQPTVARRGLQDYAWCAVRREPVLAHTFVLMKAGEQIALADYQRLFDGRCLAPIALQMEVRLWQSRAALAEALLVRDRNLQRSMTFTTVPALDWAPTAVPFIAGRKADAAAVSRIAAEEGRNQAVGRLGECVVRSDPASALTVLRTNIDTAAERKHLAALAPRIARCVQQGQTRDFNRTNLRAAMALAYYRLAVATAAQGKV